MYLTQLRIRNFRCLESVDIAPHPGINLIVGTNASGKSSLLEAIHFLARAQSFRGTPTDRLIRQGDDELSVFGRLHSNGADQPIGVIRRERQTRIKISNEECGILQLVEILPLQIIDPQIQQLLEEGPDQRRKFLDWGVFHVEQKFYPAWLRFQRALRQRNRALRENGTPAHIAAWNNEYSESARMVDQHRREYLEALKPGLTKILEGMIGWQAVELDYHQGWPQEADLLEALDRGFLRDLELGHTQYGPHRADLRIRYAGRTARGNASRGEQKLLSAGLLLAQAQMLHERTSRQPLLLIDDLAAELDHTHRQALFSQITKLGAQCFLSFLEQGSIPAGNHPATMFHVEHGRVTPMV